MTLRRALVLARDLDRALARDRDRDRDLARDLVRDLARARDVALNLDRDLDRSLADDLDHGSVAVMGWALAQALTLALRRPTDAKTWPAQFSEEFAGLVGIADNSYLVSLDTLADKTTDAVQAVQQIVIGRGKPAGMPRAATVSRRLQQTAVVVFDQREQLTSGRATSMRLAALCLAAEADAQDQRPLGDAFREIAAGVTLLERRTSGDDPAPEMIFLATE